MEIFFDYDANGDGVTDVTAFDSDGDSVADLWTVDSNEDGLVDAVAEDTDHNGLADYLVLDANEDGQPDGWASDVNGDGVIDSNAAPEDWSMSGPGVTTPLLTRKIRNCRRSMTERSPRLMGRAERLPSATPWLWPQIAASM